MPAVIGKALQVAWQIIAADHVEHQINAARIGDPHHFGNKVLRLVINGMRRPQRQRGGAFGGIASGDDDGHPERAAKLDRGDTDTAGAAMDEEGFAGPGMAAVHDIRPDGEPCFRQPGGISHRHARRHRQALPGGCRAIFGIATASDKRADCITDPPALDRPAHRDHDAGDFQPRDRRHAGRHRVQAQPLQHIRAIDPGGGDLDQHLVRPGLWHRAGNGYQHIWPARSSGIDGGHGGGYGHMRSSLTADIDLAAARVNAFAADEAFDV